MNLLKSSVSSLILAAALAGCGGGGKDAGTSPFLGTGSSSGSGSVSNGTTVTSNSSGSVILNLSNAQVSSSQPGTVTAVVKDAAGVVVSNALVQFAVSSSIAQVNPSSALTNQLGQAATTLTPAAGFTSGAAYVTASADTAAGSLTSKTAFSVSATNVSLTSAVTGTPDISAYGSTSVDFQVTGASSATPVTVNVTSTCASNGKAIISPSSLTVTAQSGTVTYQDKACSSTDRISVQIAGTTQQRFADLVVKPAETQGIQFVDVDPSNGVICLKGSGCASSANVKFKVTTSSGEGKPNVPVDFSLDDSVASFATLGSTSGNTLSDGTVVVSVSSKTTPTPIRVKAKVHNTVFQTVSNTLTINAGLPTGNGISFASDKWALDNTVDGDSAKLTIHLVDRFGNPVPVNTAVSFVADAGTVVPASCTTTSSGACDVTYIVSNPRPTNGRAHVLAYVKGEESFIDSNASGDYTLGESIGQLSVGVCLDKNENNTCDVSSGEFIVGSNVSPDSDNGTWDGNGDAFIRLQRTFFFSQTTATPKLYKAAGGVCSADPVDNAYMTVSMGTAPRKIISFCVRDGNVSSAAFTAASLLGGNPIASKSELSVAPTISTVSAAIDNSPIPDVVSGPTLHNVTIRNAASPPTTLTAGGNIDISFKMGSKTISILNAITVNP